MERVNCGICKDTTAQYFFFLSTNEFLVKEAPNSILGEEFVGFLGGFNVFCATAPVQFCHSIYKHVRSISVVLIAFPTTHDHI